MSGAPSAGRRRRLTALLRKETVQVVRDPSNILIAFVLPMLLIFLFGYGVSLDTGRTRIGVSNASGGEKAASLLAALGGSRWLDLARTGPVPSLRDDLVAGRVRGVVVIPADFERRLAQGGDGALQIMTDGSQPNGAGFTAAYVDGVFRNWMAAQDLGATRTARPPIELATRFRYNPELASRYFLVPGAIAIIMTLIGTLLTALVIAREWERGTMEALMATPVTVGEIIAGKILPYFVLGLGSMALCTLLAVTVFSVPLRGSVPALLLLASAFLMPALGQGLLISAAVRNQFVASQVALLSAFLPSFLLSGAIFEISSMPTPIRVISHLVPAGYLIPSIQTVFSVGDVWPMFLRSVATLLAFGGLFFTLAFRLTSKRLD